MYYDQFSELPIQAGQYPRYQYLGFVVGLHIDPAHVPRTCCGLASQKISLNVLDKIPRHGGQHAS